MVRQTSVQFQGLIPAIDRKRINQPFVVAGKNFLVPVDGPLSAFGKVDVLLDAITSPEYVQSFRISTTQVFVFTKNAVLEFDSVENAFVPVYVFAELTTVFPWSHAIVGGVHYFVREGTNLLQYDDTTGQWQTLSGGAYPVNPYAVTQSAGRLVVLSATWATWSAIDDGTDIATSLATGAGAQSLAILGNGTPQAVHQTADGFITFTESGIMKSEIINAVNPFRHYILSNDTIAVSPYAIADLGEKDHVLLTRTGLFYTKGKTPELWQPLMSEYMHNKLLPTLDLTQDAIVRLSYDVDRAWFIVSIAEQQQTGVYTKAYVLDKRSEQWGSFDQNHSGFLDVNFTSGAFIGFNFGFISPNGDLHRFSDEAFDSVFPQETWNLYSNEGKPEYPARYEPVSTAFPSAMFIRHADEGVFPQLGLFNTNAVLEEAIEPELQTVVESDAVTSTVAVPVTDTFTDTDGVALASHTENGLVYTLDSGSACLIKTNRLHANGSEGVQSVNAKSATKFVEVAINFFVVSTNLAAFGSPEVRIAVDAASSSYIAVGFYNGASGKAVYVHMQKSAVAALRSDYIVQSVSVNDTIAVKVRVTEANTIELYVSDVLVKTIALVAELIAVNGQSIVIASKNREGAISNATDGVHLSDVVVTDLVQINQMPANTQTSQGMQHMYNAVVENAIATLDSFVEVGPFRMPSENDIDELGLVNNLNVAMLDSGAGDSDDDWLKDYPSDIIEDWLLLTAEEDWGFAASSTADADVSITGTIDGYATWEEQQFALTEFVASGRSKLYDVQCNGLYHLIKLDATEVNKSIALKMMELNYFPTGRL